MYPVRQHLTECSTGKGTGRKLPWEITTASEGTPNSSNDPGILASNAISRLEVGSAGVGVHQMDAGNEPAVGGASIEVDEVVALDADGDEPALIQILIRNNPTSGSLTILPIGRHEARERCVPGV